MMKKIIRGLCTALILTLTLSALLACGGGGGDKAGKTQTDDYGFERPENCWLTECLILPQYPSPEEVFGTGGTSGLASDWALEQNGKPSEFGYGIYYLVYLVYGTPTPGSEIDSYLKFSLVEEMSVLYDEACVSLSNTNDQIDAFGDLEATLDMSLPADERLQVSFASEKDYVQGMLVIRFSVEESEVAGDLHVDLSLDVSGITSNYKVDAQELLRLGTESAYGKVGAEVSNLSVRYLTQDAYNGGRYDESAIISTATFEGGQYCYMVLDFTIKALSDNDGANNLRVMAYVPERNTMAATIEEAPTGKIEETVKDGVTTIYAAYGVPTKTGESKSVRMLLRLLAVSGGEVDLDLFITGDENTFVSGQTHVSQTVDTGEPTLSYSLNSDGKSYTVSGLLSNSLTAINVPDALGDGYPVTAIKSGIFQGNTKITHLSVGNHVKQITAKDFSGCTALRSVELGNGVQAIGDEAFSGCTALVSLKLGDGLISIGKKAFLNCRLLPNVAFGPSLAHVGDAAFSGCAGLGELTVGNALQTVGANAFFGCASLKELTLPDSVTSVGAKAFGGCTGLETVTLGRNANLAEGALNGCGSIKTMTLSYVKAVPFGYFFGMDSYSDGMTVTQKYNSSTRNYCVPSRLASVTVKSGSIPADAFKGFSSLTAVRVEREVREVGDAAFSGCTALQSFYMGSNGFYSGYTNNTFYKAGKTSGGIRVTVGPAVSRIPNALFGLSTSTPESDALPVLLSVEFEQGSTCTSIGQHAFYCTSLTSITLPDTVQTIGDSAFRGGALQSITLPKDLRRLDQYAFEGCQYLTSVVIPDKVQSISNSCFSGCRRLTSVTIGKGVTYVAQGAFWGCSYLEELYLNATNLSGWGMTIGSTPELPFESAGRGGSGFTLYVGANVTHLPEYMFYSDEPGNQGLSPKITRVVFAEGSVCESIGKYAFYRCDSLSRIDFMGTTTQWEAITKNSEWRSGTALTQVNCSNGTVTL